MMHLLDTSVFLPAIYAGHSEHKNARAWFDKNKHQGWGISAETYLGTMRLLMNPAVMGSNILSIVQAIDAIDDTLGGEHPGRLIFASQKPNRALFAKAQGHKQVMDIWQVQMARQENYKLATSDAGTLSDWPDDTVKV